MTQLLYTEVYDRDLLRALVSPETSFGFACWCMARGDRPLPMEPELVRRLPGWLNADLIVVSAQPDGDHLYERYGATTVAHTGYDMTGKRVSEFKGPLRDFFHGIFERSLREQQSLATVHRLGHFNERPLWERVIMPVLRDGAPTVLYMVNRARKLGDDIHFVRPRAKCNGLILLQFVRNSGAAVDAMIVGANHAALKLAGRRLEELLHKSMLACFPGIVDRGLWSHYLAVAASRSPCRLMIDYCADGVAGVFDVEISPFRDGVSIDFAAAAGRRSQAA